MPSENNKKKLLIVDDSQIDRSILKNILSGYCYIEEAENGYAALELLMGQDDFDGMLLDISMPILDGFNVLDILDKNHISIPTILMSAEATSENVRRAARHQVTEFIGKPYEPDVILPRAKKVFGVDTEEKLSPVRLEEETRGGMEAYETDMYIARLSSVYQGYLKNRDQDDSRYRRVSALMEILLNAYEQPGKLPLDANTVRVASKAAYFYDIGMMGIPDELVEKGELSEDENETYESHTQIGANILALNGSRACRAFVRLGSEICLTHHERYDGKGFPRGTQGNKNSAYGQFCRLAIRFDEAFRFDELFVENKDVSRVQFDLAMNELNVDRGMFAPEYMSLLEKCKGDILRYYKKLDVKRSALV